MNYKYIQKTPLYKSFSDIGKRIFLPEGIFYWARRAKNEAELIGTIGSAYGFEKDFIDGGSSDWMPCYLKEISEYSNLMINEIVTYPSIGGLHETREIWKEWILKKSFYNEEKENKKMKNLKKYITTPIITTGVTNGIFQSCTLFLNPGEKIIMPNKRWGNYDNIICKFIGASIEFFEFFEDQNLNLDGIKEAIDKVGTNQNKILILLNFPNNPTGYVPNKEESIELVKLLKESQESLQKPVIILVDDAYEPYVYTDNVLNRSIFYDLHELEEDIIPIKLDGITKELLMYGGRIGFITIGLKENWFETDDDLETLKKEIDNKLEGFIRATISNCNHFYQVVTKKLFEEKGISQMLKSRDIVKNLLFERYKKINSELMRINNPHISIDPNSGGFFLFVNLDPNKIKASEFADHLLKKYKVGIIPIEKLDENVNGIRIAYCSVDINEIPKLIERINLALDEF
jgi:aspartate/methionine/tyrosine aminotransferase